MNDHSTRRRACARWLQVLPALSLAIGALGGLSAPVCPALGAAPEPAPIPKRWQLDAEVSHLRMSVVDLPDGPRAFFFLTYKVTNNSPADLLFAPAFELATDDMAVLRSGRDVPVAATNIMLERLENPLLMDQISIVGTLLRGEENAKEGLVMWPVPALFQSEVIVYAAGFSGETTTLDLPSPVTGKLERKVLRKTLMLRYRLPGVLNPAAGADLEPVETRWIMR